MNVLNDYLNRCGSEIQKNVGKIIVYSSKKEVKDVCRKGSKTQRNMLLMGPCINNAGRPLSRCINKVLDALVGIQNADDKIKFPLVCWWVKTIHIFYFHKPYSCILPYSCIHQIQRMIICDLVLFCINIHFLLRPWVYSLLKSIVLF